AAKRGQAALLGARPPGLVAAAHLEDPAAAGDGGELADLGLEGREQLLRDPRRAQEPAALGAVADLDAIPHGSVASHVRSGRGGPRAPRSGGSGPGREADLEALLGARVAAHLAPGAGELDAARGVGDAQVDVRPLPGGLRG